MARQNENGEWVDFHWDDELLNVDDIVKHLRPICIGTYFIGSKSRKIKICDGCGFIKECKRKKINIKKHNKER
jgi:hypothetical protein